MSMKTRSKIVLLRHGQSEWNRLNLFTGWVDVPLSPAGIEEALNAGKSFSAANVLYKTAAILFLGIAVAVLAKYVDPSCRFIGCNLKVSAVDLTHGSTETRTQLAQSTVRSQH